MGLKEGSFRASETYVRVVFCWLKCVCCSKLAKQFTVHIATYYGNEF